MEPPSLHARKSWSFEKDQNESFSNTFNMDTAPFLDHDQALKQKPLAAELIDSEEQDRIINDPQTMLRIRPCKLLHSNISHIRRTKPFSFLSNLPKNYEEPYEGYSIAVVQWVRPPSSGKRYTLLRLLDMSLATIFKVSPVAYAFVYPIKTSRPLQLAPFDLILLENPLLLRSAKTAPIPLAITLKWNQVYLLGQCVDLKPCAATSCHQFVKPSTNARCEYHLLEFLKKAKNGRMEFSTTSTPLQLTDAYSKNASVALADLEQKSGGLVYWLGSQIIAPFESKILLKSHPKRKKLIHETMQQCHSVGAQYLRKLHDIDDSNFHKDQKEKRKDEKKKIELKKGIESILAVRFVKRHFDAREKPSPKKQKIQPTTGSEPIDGTLETDSDSLEIIPSVVSETEAHIGLEQVK